MADKSNVKAPELNSSGYSKYYYYKVVFLLSIVVSAFMFLPFVLKGDGYFIYYGDFNAQQIPFHQHAVEMIRSGNFNWDWYTDLGSNLIGDYSFYMSTSPFFWIMCLFPSSITAYLIAPVLCLKFTVAAICAYAYLKRFVRKPFLAVAGALMYAFCGAQIANIFFNHFHDSVAFFPLLLLGIEEFVQNNRRGVFAFAVFICASVNYFFFAGEAVFCIFYFFFRASSLSFRLTTKKFFWLAFEAVLGLVMSLCMFLTAVLSITGNYRLDRAFSSLRKALIWETKGELYTKRYGHILQSLFYPPDIPSRPEFFGGMDIEDSAQSHSTRWASNAVWVPLFGMTGALTYIWNRRKSWLSHFIIFLVICSLVPVLNSLFVMGNTSYYARWMYMLSLMLVVATVISLDRNEMKWNVGIAVSAICSFLILIPSFISWKVVKDVWTTTRSRYPERIMLSLIIVICCLIAVYCLIKFFRGRRIFPKLVTGLVAAVSLFYGVCHIYTGKLHCQQASVDNIIDRYLGTTIDMAPTGENGTDGAATEGIAPLDNIYDHFYRIDGYCRQEGTSTYKNSLDNVGLYFNLPSIQCFNSTVPSSIMGFYKTATGKDRSVASRPLNTLYGLRSFLSVKYVFVENYGGRVGGYEKNPMFGFTEEPVSKQGTSINSKGQEDYNFFVYENEYYLSMGYTYTEFMTLTEFKKIGAGNRHIYLCKYLVVPDEEAEEYAKYMTEVKKADIPDANSDTFIQAVEERKNGDISESFEWSSKGFTAVIDMASENYVFFSIPYDVKEMAGIDLGGWSAKVNGKKVEIKMVFDGLMAVKAPAGEDVVIDFKYNTPGRSFGIIATVVGFVVLGAYLVFFRKVKNEQPTYAFFSDVYYEELGYPEDQTDPYEFKGLKKLMAKFKKSNKDS